jgi:hypothetical protein
MARACNHAMRLLPNAVRVRAQLPSTNRGRVGHTKLVVHAQLPAEHDAYPAAEQLKKVKVTQVHTLECCKDERTIISLDLLG